MSDYILNLDKPRKLKFGFQATKLLEDKFDKKQLDAEMIQNMQISEFTYFIWAGLVWEDAELTEEKLIELLDEKIPETYTIVSLINIVAGAFMDHLGVSVKKKSTKLKTATMTMPKKKPSKSASQKTNSMR